MNLPRKTNTKLFDLSLGKASVLGFALILSILAGCVINFKSEKPPTKGVINVGVNYQYPGKNEFSTFKHYYKKELESGRYAQTDHIELDPSQQLLILNKALVLHFYDMPATFRHKDESGNGTPQMLRIAADTLDHTVSWSGTIDDLHPNNYHIKELVQYVDSIVKSTSDYQDLPKAKGEE